MANNRFQATPELTDLLVRSGSTKKEEALGANAEFAKALELPLRQGVLNGDILDGIFEPVVLAQSATPEFPLDFLAPGTEKDFVAYTIPIMVIFHNVTLKAIMSWFQPMTLALVSIIF